MTETPQTTTARPDRMQRLASGPLKKEADTIKAMIEIYCRAHHGGAVNEKGERGLCPECQALTDYALKRLACCPFGEAKPVCAKCKVHCYKPEERKRIGEVMRFAGPRIMMAHPLLALDHIWKSITVKAPEKPRNPKAAQKPTKEN